MTLFDESNDEFDDESELYVHLWLVNLESYETLHHKTLKNVSDGQLAVASPSVPLDRNISLMGFQPEANQTK